MFTSEIVTKSIQSAKDKFNQTVSFDVTRRSDPLGKRIEVTGYSDDVVMFGDHKQIDMIWPDDDKVIFQNGAEMSVTFDDGEWFFDVDKVPNGCTVSKEGLERREFNSTLRSERVVMECEEDIGRALGQQ